MTFVADEDYAFYLECLEDASVRSGCAVHAYVLMTNHVHLLVTPDSADGLGRMMQSVGRRYVRYFNHVRHRTGTLWEGPRHSGGGGQLFPGLLPLHRNEPGASGDGGGSR